MSTQRTFSLWTAVVMFAACGPSGPVPTPEVTDGGISAVVGGTAEPNYKYPWVVSVHTQGAPCRGVLLTPEWVLTAGHCVFGSTGTTVSYTRTDPYSGSVHEEQQIVPHSGVIVHDQIHEPSLNENDIALVRLPQPFAITPYIQTVGLPQTPTSAGLMGTVATSGHTNSTLPPGTFAIFRAPVPPLGWGKAFAIGTTNETGALCQGDSGSGFVTYEDGRAIVHGILSEVSGDCVTASGHLARFIDVFQYKDWILEKMRVPGAEYLVAGTNRVRWRGRPSRGVMGIGCVNKFGTMWGPLNVAGVEEGANCEAGQTQSVVFSLSDVQMGPVPLAIKSFTMRTDCPPSAPTVVNLPFTDRWASYYGTVPVNPNSPLGICLCEFTCTVGLAVGGNTGGVATKN